MLILLLINDIILLSYFVILSYSLISLSFLIIFSSNLSSLIQSKPNQISILILIKTISIYVFFVYYIYQSFQEFAGRTLPNHRPSPHALQALRRCLVALDWPREWPGAHWDNPRRRSRSRRSHGDRRSVRRPSWVSFLMIPQKVRQ